MAAFLLTGDLIIKPLFSQNSSKSLVAFLLTFVMMAVVVTGLYTDYLNPVRERLAFLTEPFYKLTSSPASLAEWGATNTMTRRELVNEIETLKSELLIHQRKLQQMANLAAENVRLRQLLNASELLQDSVLITELIGVSPNPLSHKVTINRGTQSGVYKGQAVLDAFGLVGQVTEVARDSATVLLISDATHAIPVQVNRNGVRVIAEGTGDTGRLLLRHVSTNIDIRVGDLLVSSGLGERFPVGYPVAEVDSVVQDPGRAFVTITAKPKAHLDRSRHLLLVFDDRVSASDDALATARSLRSDSARTSKAQVGGP